MAKTRRDDIEDSFGIMRPVIANMFTELGIDNPEAVDRATMYAAVQNRHGFEEGIAVVHDNAVVTSREAAERERSFRMNFVGNIG